MTVGILSPSCVIALGSASPPTTTSAATTTTFLQVAHFTDAQPPSSFSQLDIYVKSSEFGTVWNSPMHLSSFVNNRSTLLIQIHIQTTTTTTTTTTTENTPITPEITSTLQTSLLLAGLVAISEQRKDDEVIWQVQKRSTDIRLQARPLTTTTTTTAMMVDENTLLESHLLAPPPAMSATATKNGDDCSGREPCADCTCGRKESSSTGNTSTTLQDKTQQLSSSSTSVKSSSCGKCNLGDAFRCASCPYLGKPAFKAGEEHLVLDLQDDF